MGSRCKEFVSSPGTRCTFRLEGVDAASVSVLGTFNQWSTTRDLMRYVNGRWEAHIVIPAGRHSYCFFAIERQGGLRGTLIQMGSTLDVGLSDSSLLDAGHELQNEPGFEQFFQLGA